MIDKKFEVADAIRIVHPEAFIAGHASRDPEVESLRKQLEEAAYLLKFIQNKRMPPYQEVREWLSKYPAPPSLAVAVDPSLDKDQWQLRDPENGKVLFDSKHPASEGTSSGGENGR